MPSRLQLTSVTIGCPRPRDLAAFYAALLGGTVASSEPPADNEPDGAGWAQVRTESDYGTIRLNFEYESAWHEIVWPSETGKQHITQHLDIQVDDLDAAAAHAIACGAREDAYQPQESVRVMRDPAGHPFCLFLDS